MSENEPSQTDQILQPQIPESSVDTPSRTYSKRTVSIVLAAGLVSSGFSVNAYKAYSDNKDLRSDLFVAKQTIAAQGIITDRLAGIIAGQNDISKNVITGTSLRRPDDLPGASEVVSAPDDNMMTAATVKIMTRYKGDTYPFSDNCTGLKVTIDRSPYIAAAAHCFSINTPYAKGGPLRGKDLLQSAFEVKSALDSEYAVRKAGTDVLTDQLAPAIAISVDYERDVALMKIDASSQAARQVDEMPAIDYRFYAAGRTAVLGAHTLVYSMPGAANNKVLKGEGVYLGTVIDPDTEYKTMDIIGLTNAPTPDKDACNYGASGSGAIIAGGIVTGPLSTRNNNFYDPGSPENTPDSIQYSTINRLELEEQLNVDTSSFNTLCGYANIDTNTIDDLLNGFQNEYVGPQHLVGTGMK